MNTPSLRVRSIDIFERPVTLRLPFRFGAATVTRCPQAFVRVVVEVGGRSHTGASAELMVPKWFDKSPALTHEQNFEQLRTALRLARDAYLSADAALNPWQLHLHAGLAAVERGVAQGLPRLAAQFGPAQLDKAVADAALAAAGLGWSAGVQAGVLGDPFSPQLKLLAPPSVALRHTVGLADRLRADEPGPDPQDGLPATLQAAITAYGLTHFKLKLRGELERDITRLSAIAAVLQAHAPDYRVTLDGNETFADAHAVAALWQAVQATPALATLCKRTLLLEQPIVRQQALNTPLPTMTPRVPVILDESDDHDEALDQGLALGYAGISSKACKGLYRSLRNAAALAGRPGGLLSGEDLTCQAGLAVQQDTLLAASLGVAHIERNGHHYVDGFGIAPAAEAQGFLQAHPGLYAQGANGRVRLAVRQGRLDLRSLHGPGFARQAQPLWAELSELA